MSALCFKTANRGTQKMLKISVLKVEHPSCLWGRVIRSPSGNTESAEHYNNLQTQINLFYQDVTLNLDKLKPKSLKEGQVCMVYWSVMKTWCRAVVESIITDSVSCKVRCLLVDHGERVLILSDQIQMAMPEFLQLPFWVRKFRLAGIKPTTLRVSVCMEKAELIPSSQWDSSATLYLHKLLQASTQTEAVLLESESDSTSIELYVTIGNIKICVNDDMVAKKFAYYDRGSTESAGMDEGDRCPIMFNILNQIGSLSPNMLKAPPVTSQFPTASEGVDWLKGDTHPKSQQPELVTSEGDCRSKVPEAQLFPSSQSMNGLDTAAERFLKFLNPDRIYQPGAPHVDQNEEQNDCPSEEMPVTANVPCPEQELTQKSGAEDLLVSVNCLADEESSHLSRSQQSGPAEVDGKRRTEEEWACSRLLEWLNPEPPHHDPDTADDWVIPSNERRNGILVHSALPVEPCNNLDDAPITDTLRLGLRRKQYSTLSPADQYSWPAVARGCNTITVSHNADQPLTYLTPFLTHILLNSIFSSLTSSSGPIAVVLCPGWEKVQVVYELLEESKVAHILHPVVVLLGTGKDEAKSVKIPKNCLLLLTTPFTLVRLLSCHCFLFLRLYHLLLDEADKLFTLAPDQMETILQHFKKVTSSEDKASCPQQLVVMAKKWTNHMEGLLANHMPYSCIVITIPEEAALYGNVQQIILMTFESSKISVLLGTLDFNPDVGQKTLVVVDSVQEVEDVFKAVSNKSAFCLKTHEGITHQFDFVIQQWRKNIGPGTHVILVTTNKCLKGLDIRDATCVVHYSFPSSPKLFGSRLFCMAENFRNLSKRVWLKEEAESSPHVTRSVLLISEKNARHVVGVLRYLGRTNAPLPSELLSFAQGVHIAREDQKTDRNLCSYLKSFGVCRDSAVCPDRHRFNSQLDQSELPASGVIEALPLYIKTASVFYGRISRKENDDFNTMASKMASYYADVKKGAKELLEGGLYAVQEDEVYHRVRILSVLNAGDHLFFGVLVRFIDVGKEVEVKSHQILHLPEQFHSLPAQAVEFIVCHVKPVDAETNWHPKVTRAICQKIQGLQHHARAVLSLGNTVFLDPMIRITKVPGMKTQINEYSVQSEILKTGMGVGNPEHLNLLRTMCQESLADSNKETGLRSELEDGLLSLEVKIKAEEGVLAEAFRDAECKEPAATDLLHLGSCDPLSKISSTSHSVVQASPEPELYHVPVCDPNSQLDNQTDNGQRTPQPADMKSDEPMDRDRDGEEVYPTTSLAACKNGLPEDGESNSQQVISTNETDSRDWPKRFHPEIRWYQTPDSAILTVKLINPESQRCDFYPDRVVYSGTVNGKYYRADLELHQNIAADCCSWAMKSNEPVLKLVKQQQGHWERLLNNKSIFVKYDMEHFEEDEDKTPNGLCFVEDMGHDNWFVNSESGSESD
ncbi:putative ATP-dependent RNA helicase TDRD12 isoform X2 [Mugil cephalus]|uniref:putative ATP-dependent RNA helicase TDRD12 isoform X2 n=1 Tax=Mugil cephalus TaxID=48193 RepID=UPI001FB664EC|nr:putative ATP-dependent RNA helicase TDRD12 isoform X2 [Mugil cephalus]